ncbi:MAG: OB-fold nucleic acid binding domain-containing protein [archaeon]|nr:hypothetical protein [Nanoarchaeota archaeon]
MYKIPLPELKEKIVASGKISAEELEAKIKSKISELSGLISEEGAAHIISNELGLELFAENVGKSAGRLKVREIYAGMKNVEAAVKIIQKYDVREFKKDTWSGKLCAMFVGDESGTMRVVFWNDQVNMIKDVKEGDILLVKEAYVKEGLKGQKELHLGKEGTVDINPSGINIDAVRKTSEFTRKSIEALQGDEDSIELMGTIVQVFDPRFFHVCPDCGKRVNQVGEEFSCQEHGTVAPVLSYVMNLILDDGSGNIRAVLWKNQTNHLLDKTEEDLAVFKEDPNVFEDIKNDLLGEQLNLMGRVRRNEMFDRLEFNVQIVGKADPEKEAARLEKNEELVE